MALIDTLFIVAMGLFGLTMLVIMVVYLYYFVSMIRMIHRGDDKGAKAIYKKVYRKDLP